MNVKIKSPDETKTVDVDAGPSKNRLYVLAGGKDGTSVPRTILTDSDGRIITSTELTSPLPSLNQIVRKVIAVGSTFYSDLLVTQDTAIKDFNFGGRGAGECTLAKYSPLTTEQIPGGGFNSSGNVSSWTLTGIGDSAVGSWSYATDQFTEGTGSAKYTFTKSDGNHYPEITYTWSTPKDFSEWRTIQGKVRVTVAAGGNQARTVQIRATSGTAVRIWQITGTTTTAPFSTEQWLTVVGDIESPSATAGTGSFDSTQVTSVSLRLTDGGNKTGSIWWDDIKLIGAVNIIQKIYSPGQTTSLNFDPVVIFNTNDNLLLILKNNDSTTREFQCVAAGVDIQ